MNPTSHLQLLKNNNLWPSKNEENWKYFDFKKFETSLGSKEFKPNSSEVIFSSDLSYEIKLSSNKIIIAENLKRLIEFQFVESPQYINLDSKLDFRMTRLNLESKSLKIEIQNQKDLNFKISYEAYDDNLNLFIILDIRNSDVSLLEQDLVGEGCSFTNHLQIKLENSNLEHIALFATRHEHQLALKEQVKIYNAEICVGNNSNYNNTTLIVKNRFIRIQQSVALESENATGYLNAFNISDGPNFSELRTEVLHLKPKTESRQLFKTIAADSSQSVFNGRIFVNALAQKTVASQLCQGILLHPKAEINAKPELEIYADDVKAAHGAAIGQLGQDQVFYLISRGIKPEAAYKMLSKAFAGEVLSSIRQKSFREVCQNIIDLSSEAVFAKLAEDINMLGHQR